MPIIAKISSQNQKRPLKNMLENVRRYKELYVALKTEKLFLFCKYLKDDPFMVILTLKQQAETEFSMTQKCLRSATARFTLFTST